MGSYTSFGTGACYTRHSVLLVLAVLTELKKTHMFYADTKTIFTANIHTDITGNIKKITTINTDTTVYTDTDTNTNINVGGMSPKQ